MIPDLLTLSTPGQLAALQAAAAADGHQPFRPTHGLVRAGEVVGGVSLGSSVLVQFWAHSKKLPARETFAVIRALEWGLKLRGVADLAVPVAAGSPLAPHMAGLGFAPMHPETFTLYAKHL